jgi:signal peptidase II
VARRGHERELKRGGGRRRLVLAFAALLTLCIGCDQAAKHVAVQALGDRLPISLFGEAVRLELAHNPGAFLGLGSGLGGDLRGLLFVLLVPLAIALVCVHLARASQPGAASVVGLALLAGGGLGNWLDRVMHGGVVTDFVSLGIGPLRTGVFNLADVCIVGGIALFLLAGRRGPTTGSEHQTE